jgi:hypothetical protein
MRLRPDLVEAYRGQVVALEAAFAGVRLRTTGLVITVRPLPDVDFLFPKVYGIPGQAPQLGSPEAGKDRRDQERAPTPLDRGQDIPSFVFGREIDTNLDLAFVALLHLD